MRGKKKVILLCAMLLCTVYVAAGCESDTKEDNLVSVEQADILPDVEQEAEKEVTSDTADVDETGVIYVDVCGEVNHPGVYQLTGKSRVYEAIEKAGGLTKNAAKACVNQAEKLADGQQIYILSKDEMERGGAEAGGASVSEFPVSDGKVNLNTASKEELMTLGGIGEVKADAIIRYREEHGSFQSVEDVKKIEGIKDGVFNKIKDRITI